MDGFGIGLLGLGITFVLLAIAAWIWTRGLWAESGLPAGNVIYTDSGIWLEQTESLQADDLQLVGKPDYLVEEADGMLVPVELKSGTAPAEPYATHVLQLAAYCVLVETSFGVRPAYGILQYQDRAFAVDYTAELEDEILDLLAEMREDMLHPDLPRDHEEPWRCASCGMNNYCDQRLD